MNIQYNLFRISKCCKYKLYCNFKRNQTYFAFLSVINISYIVISSVINISYIVISSVINISYIVISSAINITYIDDI